MEKIKKEIEKALEKKKAEYAKIQAQVNPLRTRMNQLDASMCELYSALDKLQAVEKIVAREL